MNQPSSAGRPEQPLLRRYLLRWTLGAVLVVWLTLVAVAWSTGLRESRHFLDGQLVSVARLWLQTHPAATPSAGILPTQDIGHEYLQEMAVLDWLDGRLVADSEQMASGLALAALPQRGFATVPYQGAGGAGERRVFAVTMDQGGHERRVLVLMDMQQRTSLGQDIAKHVAEPALLIFPLVALLLWWAIRRGLRPLNQLSHDVAALDGFAGQRLDAQHRFREFASTVTAINELVDTLQMRAQRERAFASDVAHELRTPLAAIALQASAAQHEASPARLAHLEQEALRAGHILSQLLDLARAQGAGVGPASRGRLPTSEVDVGELAARLVADHAPSAYDSGHELSLTRPEQPVTLHLQPLQLELALRNLIENALGHTPSGTQIEVAVWRSAQDGVAVSVSDDGARELPDGEIALPAGSPSGLGLGLRLVERLAEQMGASLERGAAKSPMTTCFTLRWGV